MTLSACTAACGEGEPCARLAEFHLHGWAGATRDEARALRLFERACTGRYVPACDDVVSLSAEGTPERAAAEAKLLEVAREECAKGSAVGCYYFAEARFDRGVYRRACELGSIRACSKLTYKPVATDEDDTRPAHVRGSQLRKRACEDGDAAECWSFGDLVRMMQNATKGIPESEPDAVALLGGVPLSSAPVYFDRAVALWDRECAAGWVAACVAAGDALSTAKPTPRRDEARPFYRRACDLHDEHSCEWLAK